MSNMDIKIGLSLVATSISIGCFIPYVRSILKGNTHPHVFSWITWGLTTIVAFFAQLTDGGAWGAWPIGVSGFITMGIAILAFRLRVQISITKLDRTFFMMAVSALPFWYFTHNPLWAVILLSFADTVGSWPTLRKCWDNPFKEDLWIYILLFFRNLVAIAALGHMSLTTVLFPATMSVSIAVFLIVVWGRQWVIKTRM